MKPPAKRIIALGRPTHYLVEVMGRARRACGAPSGAFSPDKEKVDCLQCMKTVAFKESK